MFKRLTNPKFVSVFLLSVFVMQAVFVLQSNANTTVMKQLNVPYVNQCLQRDQRTLYPNQIGSEPNRQICKNMCLTAAAVMVAGYFDKVNFDRNNTDTLKEFMINDPDIPERVQNGGLQIGGAFALTSYPSYNGNHVDNHAHGLIDYAKRKGLETSGIMWIPAQENDAKNFIYNAAKAAIDRGNPLIMSTKTHARVVIGYTNDGKIVAHDSFRNTNIGPSGGSFSHDGKAAIYDIPFTYTSRTYIPREQFIYMIEFKKDTNAPQSRANQKVEVVNSTSNSSWTTINVRQNIAGNVIGEIPFGQKGTVITKPMFGNGLYREEVQFDNGLRGWIASNFIAPVRNNVLSTGKDVVSNDYLVVRTNPGTSSARRGVIEPKSKGKLIETKNEKINGYSWGYIKWSNGNEGWSALEFVN
ncbi:MAG: C39 family peptidase [Patescibacteria group bacterium]